MAKDLLLPLCVLRERPMSCTGLHGLFFLFSGAVACHPALLSFQVPLCIQNLLGPISTLRQGKQKTVPWTTPKSPLPHTYTHTQCWDIEHMFEFSLSFSRELGAGNFLPVMLHWAWGSDYGERVAWIFLPALMWLVLPYLGCRRSLLSCFCISHKGNWSMCCFWIVVSVGEGKSWAFHSITVLTSILFYF